MKYLIVFVALFAVALAAPTDHDVHIVKSDSQVEHDHYSFNVETSDGKSHHEEGSVKDAGSEHEALVVHGSYTYKDEHDGHVYTVTYTADEHGFQPHGDHLPQLPKVVLEPHDHHDHHDHHGHH